MNILRLKIPHRLIMRKKVFPPFLGCFQTIPFDIGTLIAFIFYGCRIFDVDSTKCDYNISITRPCNVHPLTPQIYIVKLGFTGVYIFSYFCSKT